MARAATTREEYDKLNYPRWLYKDGEDPKIVKTPMEHAVYYRDGWSGPPLFWEDDIENLRKEIQQKELELLEMKDRLALMELKKEEEDKKEIEKAEAAIAAAGEEVRLREQIQRKNGRK